MKKSKRHRKDESPASIETKLQNGDGAKMLENSSSQCATSNNGQEIKSSELSKAGSGGLQDGPAGHIIGMDSITVQEVISDFSRRKSSRSKRIPIDLLNNYESLGSLGPSDEGVRASKRRRTEGVTSAVEMASLPGLNDGERFVAHEASAIKNGYCTICFQEHSVKGDLLVFCEGCETPVHQACYGIEVVPKSEWKCARCSQGLSPFIPSCTLCGQKGSAMKPTVEKNKWAHVLCAWWDSDVAVKDVKTMEPIYFATKPLPMRKSTCVLCHRAVGHTISCRWLGCSRMIHPMCAREKGYLSMTKEGGCVLQEAYCDRHLSRRTSVRFILERMISAKIANGSNRLLPRLQEIQAHLEEEDYYESIDNVSKDIVSACKRVLSTCSNGKSPKLRQNTLMLLAFYLSKIPNLRLVYDSCTLYPHELIPIDVENEIHDLLSRSKNPEVIDENEITKKWNQLLNEKENPETHCAVCGEDIDETAQYPFVCHGLNKTKSVHYQHFKCIKKPGIPKQQGSSLDKSFEEGFTCGVCDCTMETNSISGVAWMNLNRTESASLSKNTECTRRSLSKGSRKTNQVGNTLPRPSMLQIDVADTTKWLAALEDVMKPTDELTVLELESIFEGMNGSLDKYARGRLRLALSLFQRKQSILAHPILQLLIRDYRRLVTQRVRHDEDQAAIERKQLELTAERERILEDERRKREEADVLLQQEQDALRSTTKGLVRGRGGRRAPGRPRGSRGRGRGEGRNPRSSAQERSQARRGGRGRGRGRRGSVGNERTDDDEVLLGQETSEEVRLGTVEGNEADAPPSPLGAAAALGLKHPTGTPNAVARTAADWDAKEDLVGSSVEANQIRGGNLVAAVPPPPRDLVIIDDGTSVVASPGKFKKCLECPGCQRTKKCCKCYFCVGNDNKTTQCIMQVCTNPIPV